MKKSVLLFLACSVLLLAACQKTPESVMDGNVLRAKSSNDLLVESLVNAPADNGNQGGTTPVLSKTEHLKRDISSGGITVHIDADIKVPKITGDIRTYSAQYRFFDLFELEDLFFSGDDPMFNPGAEKTAEDDPSVGLLPGGFYFGVSEVLSASNHPTALKPGWAKGCDISPEEAQALSDKLLGRLGMNGLVIKKYANGLDDSPVMRSDYVSPVKSIGHGITTMQDLENNAEVWCIILELVQEIGTKLRIHKKKAGGIAISIRNNELFTKEWQCRISIPTQSPTYLAKTAFALFDKNYQWEHPIRSVTVRAINLFEEDCPIQYDLFTDMKSLDRQERLDAAIEQIRFRFGKDAIKNGVLFQKSKMPTERKVDLVMPTGMIG